MRPEAPALAQLPKSFWQKKEWHAHFGGHKQVCTHRWLSEQTDLPDHSLRSNMQPGMTPNASISLQAAGQIVVATIGPSYKNRSDPETLDAGSPH